MGNINGVMLQGFHWYTHAKGSFWEELGRRSKELGQAGFTAIWLPPATKCLEGNQGVGYSVYDLYDLGEFDQKGSVRTKYGTRDQYLKAIRFLQSAGLQVYADAVLNHRIGGDLPETVRTTPFPQYDRLHPKNAPQNIRTFTHFNFPGRQGHYSSFEWHWHHFDAVDYDEITREKNTVYLLEGKRFDDAVALENGNFSYLMGCDLDFENEEVRNEILRWGKWYLDTTGIDGFRMDAIKHISAWFFPLWHDQLEKHAGKDLFMVGEYWTGDLSTLCGYLDSIGSRMSVFDVPLHFHFYDAGRSGKNYDLRRILDGTLMRQRPFQAATFVDNHDSQPLQALESVVEPWFKPLAYAIILLRREGYPCVFMADYDGATYEDKGRDGNSYKIEMPSHRFLIDIFLKTRQTHAYGPQYDYFDHPNTIGWTRLGDKDHPEAMAVILSNDQPGHKWMEVGKPRTHFIDRTGHVTEPVITNEHGWGEFRCRGRSVSVWEEAS